MKSEKNTAANSVKPEISNINQGNKQNSEASKKNSNFKADALSDEELKKAEEFAGTINLRDSNAILKYGSGAQKKIAEFSSSALDSIRTKDLGEMGEMLVKIIDELQGFNAEEKGLLGFLKRKLSSISSIKAKYANAEANVEKICSVLENHQARLLKDVALLDKMYDLNKVYFKELSMYIAAGRKKLDEAKTKELPALIKKASDFESAADAQEVMDFESLCVRFDKKLHDLELTRIIALQMAPQIRLIQNNDVVMSEKIQSTLTNTIPLWKSQMVLALGAVHSAQAAGAQRKVTEMTNNLLKKNAETIQNAVGESIKESERGIVDMETIKITNEKLVATFDEVIRLQEEGQMKRRSAEVELAKIESDLKTKLIELKRNNKKINAELSQ